MGRGSSKAGGGSIKSETPIETYEKSIYKSDQEHAIIITSDGQTIKFDTGDENHVFGNEEDIKKMNGGTATHNHPNDSIFSETDVGNGIAKGNLKEMRIVTKSGEIHVLENNTESIDQRRAFSANYRNQIMKATNNVNARRKRGESVDKIEYTKMFMQNWLLNHAQDYGMSYKKKRI